MKRMLKIPVEDLGKESEKESQSELFAKAKNDLEFAVGLGEGFGHIFVYLKKGVWDEIFKDLEEGSNYKSNDTGNKQDHLFTRKGNGFGRGLGIGLGKNFAHIRKALEFRIFAKAAINIQFAIGLGEGLGYVFPYLSDELQDRILQKSKEPSLARGLGIGSQTTIIIAHIRKIRLWNRIFGTNSYSSAIPSSCQRAIVIIETFPINCSVSFCNVVLLTSSFSIRLASSST